ncbi:MAG: single-stranded-DNA-specific exonuclease RecJ [Bellilinea sp.]
MQPPSSKRWVIAEKISPQADEALTAYPPAIRQILFNRGIEDTLQAQRYMEGKAELADPYLLKVMGATVDRIVWALDHNEKMAVYGDFDVDGVTATVLMVEALRTLGGIVEPYIPNRFEEGYGLNVEALESLAEKGVQLVITVDCGIRSIVEANRANELGIDLIISDHHHPGAALPEGYAVICPKQPGDEYPDKDLAGVGVAYKIAQALFSRRSGSISYADHWLDLVALGTVADMVPLIGENRLMVRKGLHLLRMGQRLGVVSLANAARINLPSLDAGNIGFGLAPRLNAAGRLESAHDAFDLLASKDLQRTGLLAQKLDDQNRERQKQTLEMQTLAEQQLLEAEEELLIFALDPTFNAGLVGLVASKLTERYHRPAIVGTWMEGTVRASCRSIAEFHITQALDECADLMVRHGGHSLAAGFTVREEHLGELKERLVRIAWREMAGSDLRPEIKVDLEIGLKDLRPDLLDYLEMLQPTGQNNPGAVFCTRDLEIRYPKTVGNDKTHLKMSVTDGHLIFDSIAFRFGHLLADLPKRVDIAYHFEKNIYNGRETLQLRVIDIRPTGSGD